MSSIAKARHHKDGVLQTRMNRPDQRLAGVWCILLYSMNCQEQLAFIDTHPPEVGVGEDLASYLLCHRLVCDKTSHLFASPASFPAEGGG